MTLYEMKEGYLQLLAMMEDPDMDPEAIETTLEDLTDKIEDKAEGYVCIIKELTAEHDKFQAEVKRLTECCTRFGNHIQRLKDNLLSTMQAMGKPKLTTEHFRLSVAKNGGMKPLRITKEVPEEWLIMKPEVDTKRIREALESGTDLDFAHLEERGVHLNIK